MERFISTTLDFFKQDTSLISMPAILMVVSSFPYCNGFFCFFFFHPSSDNVKSYTKVTEESLTVGDEKVCT